jgi:hypothetical protein
MQNHTTNSLINTIDAFSNAEPPPVRILGDNESVNLLRAFPRFCSTRPKADEVM